MDRPLVSNRYALTHPLGSGGMGKVATARSVQLPSAASVGTPALRSIPIKMVLILGLIVSVVIGSYVYWSYTNTTDLDAAAPEVNAKENAAEPVDSMFVHRVTSESISANSTYLDNGSINGNPNAILSVTQNWNPEGDGVYNDHHVGV